MDRSRFGRRLPGYIGLGLLSLLTTLWTFWGVGEMYYEGWWGGWHNRLPYLVPGTVLLIFAAVTITWPRMGGWALIILGGTVFVWWWNKVEFAWDGLLVAFMLGGLAALTGVLFLFEARHQQHLRVEGWTPAARWFRRNLRYVAALTGPLLTAISTTLLFAPLLLTRLDDGDRGARLIEGHGVALVWAPAGPGWSEGIGPSQAAGRLLPGANLSWNDIAFYGVPPVGFGEKPGYEDVNGTAADMETTGLCRYLSEDGTTLMPEPEEIWRMPTTDEIVRSLVRGGENAGCTWDGASTNANCIRQPNKETPLWAPDASPIYYWSADEYDEESAWYVPYTGGGLYGGAINHQPKDWGNPRHGFRCVRAPRVFRDQFGGQ